MAETTSGLRSVLSVPAIYELWRKAIGSPNVRREFVDRHMRPRDGDRVLDIGCGPGGLMEYLPDVKYVGIDPSADYIDAATRQYGDRGQFSVAGVDEVDPEQLGEFDLVVATGVLHHIDDAQARKLFAVAARVLTPTGRLATLDPCYAKGQSAASRFVVGRDRGNNVRSAETYVELAREAFANVEVTVHHKLLRLPYTHAFLDCAHSNLDTHLPDDL